MEERFLTSERQDRRVERKTETVTPLTNEMINRVQYINKEPFLDGVKMDKMHIVGQVIQVEHLKQTYQITIDDGTDLIKINEAELTIKEF